MKKQFAMAFTFLSLLLTIAVTPVTAQSSTHFMRIKIPFEFTIGDKTFSPGEYIIKRSVSDRPATLSITSVDGESGEYVLTSNIQAKTRMSESRVVFHCYGDRYFLSQVWTAGESAGRELPKSIRERTMNRDLAKSAMERQTVTLVAHR